MDVGTKISKKVLYDWSDMLQDGKTTPQREEF